MVFPFFHDQEGAPEMGSVRIANLFQRSQILHARTVHLRELSGRKQI